VSPEFENLTRRIDSVPELSVSLSDAESRLDAILTTAQADLSIELELAAVAAAVEATRGSMQFWWGTGGADLLASESLSEVMLEGPGSCTINHPRGYRGFVSMVATDDALAVVAAAFGGTAAGVASFTMGIAKTAVAAAVTPQAVVIAGIGVAGTASMASAIDYIRDHTTCT
jgi:hypothetical protein